MKKNKEQPFEGKKKTIERWREALRSAESLVERAFEDGRMNMVSYTELRRKLKSFGIDADDVDDVIGVAQKAKLIFTVFPTTRGEPVKYQWILPEKREEEKAKTQQLLKAVDDVYVSRRVDHLTEAELKDALMAGGLSNDDARRAIHEAQRDCTLLFSMPDKKMGYSWIKPEERELEPVRRRLGTWFFHEWLDKKARQGQIDKDV